MNILVFFIVLVSLWIISTPIVKAQTFPRDIIGVAFPTTATIQRFVAHNTSFFALTANQTFQTNDGGQTWREVLVNGQSIQVLNTFNNRLYARLDSSSYFSSADDGRTWLSSNIKLAEYFVASSSAIFKINSGLVFRSVDGGISWVTMPLDRGIVDIAIFREKIFVVGLNRMSFFSANNGDSWSLAPIQQNPRINSSLISLASLGQSTMVAGSLHIGPVVGTYCGLPRSPALYRLKDTSWEIASLQVQLDKVYSYGNVLLGLSRAECNDGWSNGGIFTSRDGINWQAVEQKHAIGTYKEWCSFCTDPYLAGFDNNGVVYIAARQITYSGPPLPRIISVQPVLLRSLVSITTHVSQQNDAQSSLNIAPNPVSNFASLSVNLVSASEVQYEIWNVLGHLVHSSSKQFLAQGAGIIPIATDALPNGVYMVRVALRSASAAPVYLYRQFTVVH